MSFGGGDGEIKTPGILSKPDIGKWGTDKRVHQQQSEKNKCTEYFLFEERERVCVEKNTLRDAYLNDIFTIAIFLANTPTEPSAKVVEKYNWVHNHTTSISIHGF